MHVRGLIVFLNKYWHEFNRSKYKSALLSHITLQIEQLKYKRKKLLLGKVDFILHHVYYNNTLVGYKFEMTYLRQDMSKAKAKSLDTLLQKYTFKFDAVHVSALLFWLYWVIKYLGKLFYKEFWLKIPLKTCNYDHYEHILRLSLDNPYLYYCEAMPKTLTTCYYIFINNLIDFIMALNTGW